MAQTGSLPIDKLFFKLQNIIYLSLAALGAAFVQRVSGFGFGIFIMTMLPYLLPSYGEATALSGMLAAVTSVIIVWHMHRYISWRKLVPILLTFLVVSWGAVQFVAMAGDGMLKRILGLVLILASLYFFCLSEKVRIRPTLPMQLSLGTLSGVMGGLFGMQGPPAVLYFLASTERKEEYMALVQCYFLIGNLMMTLYRAQSGFVTSVVLQSWCWCLPAVLLGTWIGAKVFRLIPIKLLRKIIYAYMGVSGLIAFLL